MNTSGKALASVSSPFSYSLSGSLSRLDVAMANALFLSSMPKAFAALTRYS